MRLEEVFTEAQDHQKSTNLSWRDEEAYMYKGIKICKLYILLFEDSLTITKHLFSFYS